MKKTTDRREFIKTASAVTAAASITPFAIGAPKGRRALEAVTLGVVASTLWASCLAGCAV